MMQSKANLSGVIPLIGFSMNIKLNILQSAKSRIIIVLNLVSTPNRYIFYARIPPKTKHPQQMLIILKALRLKKLLTTP
uniref:Uncharacterized protein n=1 Tax=Pararge aegeria TaxID=116150 RepID=S4P138_9NEOP